MEELRFEGEFHVSETPGGVDYIVGRVVRLESSIEILGAFYQNITLGVSK